mmetsp:Transcript_19068/g.64923  ORF Transcript_19068/g.64923 Transcript_19068/m.64923 type:complete len:238 (-) Transcript_19068:2969-3682(-)
MIFSVSPLFSSTCIALSLSPACVYFLHARWNDPWRLQHFAILRSCTWRSSSETSPLGGVICSAISSVMSTLLSSASVSARSCCPLVTRRLTALANWPFSMKKSAQRASSAGSALDEAPSSSASSLSASKSCASKHSSSARFVLPPFWNSITALSASPFSSRYSAVSSMVRLSACRARLTSSWSMPNCFASLTAWLKRLARVKYCTASGTRSWASNCRARWNAPATSPLSTTSCIAAS